MTHEEMQKALLDGRAAVKYAQEHFEQLKTEADNADIIKYGSACSGIGQFCPSLIKPRIFYNFKKGRFLKEKPQTERYAVYEVDKGNNPIRLRTYNKFGCDMSVYFFEKDGYRYAPAFIGETDHDYMKMSFKFRCENDRVMEYYEIESSRVSGECYDYSHLDEGYIECYVFYYVGSSVSFNEKSEEEKKFMEYLVSSLEEKGRRVNYSPDIIRLDEYSYRIFLDGRKITNIDEYRIDKGELIPARQFKCK